MSSINEVGLRLAWENSRHIATPPLVSSRNDQKYYSQKSPLEIGVRNQWKSKNVPRYGSDNEIYTLNIKFQAVQVNVPLFLVKSSKYYIPYSNKVNWSFPCSPKHITHMSVISCFMRRLGFLLNCTCILTFSVYLSPAISINENQSLIAINIINNNQ